MAIRPSLLEAVRQKLENTRTALRSSDFTIAEFLNKSEEPCVAIVFRYGTGFSFNFHVPAKKHIDKQNPERYGSAEYYVFSCTVSPGYQSVQENLIATDRSGLLSEIEDWVQRVYEDHMLTPVGRKINEFSKLFDDMKLRAASVSDEHMVKSEIEQCNEALDKVKEEISSHLEKDISDKEDLRRQITSLNQDIEFLKQNIELLTKKNWLVMCATRLMAWTEKIGPRQLSASVKALKFLTPENGPALDAIADIIDATDVKPSA